MRKPNGLVVEVIEQFLEQQRNLTFLNNFDEALRGRKQRLPNRELETPTTQLAWRLYDLYRCHFFMLRVNSLKLAEIARGIMWAYQAGNPTVQISLVRALLEHLSALSFQTDELSKISKNLSGQGDIGKILGLILSHQKKLERMYYGRSTTGGADHPKRFHVDDFRPILQREYPEQDAVYSTLCEYVHPNYGSNSLVSSGTLGEGTLSQPLSAFEAQISLASACAIKCLALATGYELEGSGYLIKLDNYIEIASLDREKPTTVFVKKGLSTLGDGSSQDTAIQFINARTHNEAIEMVHRYLEREKLRNNGRQIAGIADGFLFEVIQTNKGPVWFKFKMS